MNVYFAQSGADGPIKIGCSYHPERRIKMLQRLGEPKIRLLATVAGSQKEEGTFHRMFADLRLRGEWFRAAPALLETIEQIKSGSFDMGSMPIRTSPFRRAVALDVWAKRRELAARDESRAA